MLQLDGEPFWTPAEQAEIMAELARPGSPCAYVVGVEADWLLPHPDDAPSSDEDSVSPLPLAPFEVAAGGGSAVAAQTIPAPMEVDAEEAPLDDDDEEEGAQWLEEWLRGL